MRSSRSAAMGLIAAGVLIVSGIMPAESQTAAVAPADDWAGPLAPDLPIAKSFDDAAATFAGVSDNPMTKWEYRVWCQTGYHHDDDAGTGQPIDLPLTDPRHDRVSPLGYLDPSAAQQMPRGGVKFMDNAWYFGTDYTGMVVTRTPNGSLLVFDTLTTPEAARTQFLSQAKAAGLDLTKIKTIFLGHSHGDHIGGADTIKKAYAPNAKIVMGQPDADVVRERRAQLVLNRDDYTPEQYRARLLALPKKIDITVPAYDGHTVGMEKVRAGGVETTAILQPGHTIGQMSVIVPVVHKGVTRKLLVWSGNDNIEAAGQYAISTEFVAGIAKQEGADAFINTHAYQLAAFSHLRDLKENPNTRNWFIFGKEGLQQHLAVFALCQRAGEQRLIDGTWKKM
jgi:glyoxylase-like metal-dependent hydrolase (beta-lactamase superfamily II)